MVELTINDVKFSVNVYGTVVGELYSHFKTVDDDYGFTIENPRRTMEDWELPRKYMGYECKAEGDISSYRVDKADNKLIFKFKLKPWPYSDDFDKILDNIRYTRDPDKLSVVVPGSKEDKDLPW